jgi:hypothetical protein
MLKRIKFWLIPALIFSAGVGVGLLLVKNNNPAPIIIQKTP